MAEIANGDFGVSQKSPIRDRCIQLIQDGRIESFIDFFNLTHSTASISKPTILPNGPDLSTSYKENRVLPEDERERNKILDIYDDEVEKMAMHTESSLSQIYQKLETIEETKWHGRTVESLSFIPPGDAQLLFSSITDVSRYFLSKENIEMAMVYARKALAVVHNDSSDHKYPRSEAEALLNLGQILELQGRGWKCVMFVDANEESVNLFEQCRELASKFEMKEMQLLASKNLVQALLQNAQKVCE